ncbi:hypothetical protein JCM8202_005034 [Rhodotorula sphaerocarpa]
MAQPTTLDAAVMLQKAFEGSGPISPEQQSCLPEAMLHLQLYPHDTNFVFAPTPNTGYGVLVCMEESCYDEIQLEPSPFVADGGLRRGVGWLHKYGDHIRTKREHVKARDARLQLDKAIKMEAPPESWTPKQESTSYHPVPVAGPSRSASGSAVGVASSSGLAASSPSVSRPTKKRPSDPLAGRSSAGPVFSDDHEPLDKKPKLTAEHGVLQPARQNMLDAIAAHQQAMSASTLLAQHQAAALSAGTAEDEESALWRAVDGGHHMNQEELEQFVKGVCDSEGFEGNANVNNAAKVIGLKSQQDYLPHMRIRLMPHQIIACAWMKDQEAGKHYGGILADEMGLGKTVEAIATCILNPSTDPSEKTTLILAPVALLQQWKEELEEKVEKDYVSVLIYHGPDRRRFKEKHLRKHDFVLTTFGTLISDFGDDESMEKKAKAKAKREEKRTGEAQDWEDYIETTEDGPLFKMSFYRVIIDEAQVIRNRGTKVSRAVKHIDSLYRWALTGTPVTNSLADLFPLFRFLRIKTWHDWTRYREQVCLYEAKNPNMAGRKAQVILRGCMLRRKKDSQLDGKELVTLPKKTVDMHELEFSPEEREIYEMLETRAQQKFNKFLKAGTVMRNYSHILVLLLRLRQVCVHPALIIDAEQTLVKKEELKQAIKKDAARAEQEVGVAFVAALRKKLLNAAIERIEAERKGAAIAEDECAICVEPYEQTEGSAVVTRCGHIFCVNCVEDYLKSTPAQDHDEEGAEARCAENQRPCPMCRRPFAREEAYHLQAFEPTDEELCVAANMNVEEGRDDEDDEDADGTLGGFIVDDDAEDDDGDYGTSQKKDKKKKVKMPNRAVVQSSDESEAEEESAPTRRTSTSKPPQQEKGKEKEVAPAQLTWAEQEPSTKILWAFNELDRMFKENPTDKVIIISSFTSALELMDQFLQRKGIRTCRYQGDRNISEREQAIRVLKKSKKCRVMLLSLKCGGVGLTLTRANRVIALDLAWSTAVENQAFDRVHRIGQEKEVFVNRLMIKDTVEQRILALQHKKQSLADAATGEGTGEKIGRLTVADLAGLFGLNRHGERVKARAVQPAQGAGNE